MPVSAHATICLFSVRSIDCSNARPLLIVNRRSLNACSRGHREVTNWPPLQQFIEDRLWFRVSLQERPWLIHLNILHLEKAVQIHIYQKTASGRKRLIKDFLFGRPHVGSEFRQLRAFFLRSVCQICCR